MTATTQYNSPAALRRVIREGKHSGPTSGLCLGFVQANVVILPEREADDFARFCRWNSRACPLLLQTAPGQFEPHEAAPGADIRTDVPRYRVFRRGVADETERTDIRELWRDDLVTFLLGCSFTFDAVLAAAGLPVRHVDEGRNVPMYRTSIPCRPSGNFSGPLVVSMRPFAPEQLEMVYEVTGNYPQMHGAPLHAGDPRVLGIADLNRPDFGDAVTVRPDETPVFWACGVTPQLALLAAEPEIAVSHSPGCMFVTDWREDEFLAAGKNERS